MYDISKNKQLWVSMFVRMFLLLTRAKTEFL